MITPNVGTVKPLGFGAGAMGSWRNTWATACWCSRHFDLIGGRDTPGASKIEKL
jgi:hypothetical protein